MTVLTFNTEPRSAPAATIRGKAIADTSVIARAFVDVIAAGGGTFRRGARGGGCQEAQHN